MIVAQTKYVGLTLLSRSPFVSYPATLLLSASQADMLVLPFPRKIHLRLGMLLCKCEGPSRKCSLIIHFSYGCFHVDDWMSTLLQKRKKKYFFSFVSWRSFFLCFSSLLEKKIIMWNSHVSASQRAGLELMDMMAVYQEGAYERLCRWSFSRWIKTCNSFNFLLIGVRCLSC